MAAPLAPAACADRRRPMLEPPFIHDASGHVIRDPRSRLAAYDDLVLDMASVMCLFVGKSGECLRDDLRGAGFSEGEIERAHHDAHAVAHQRLAPRQIDREQVAAMADALAERPLSGSDRVNIATLVAAGFSDPEIHRHLDEAVATLQRRQGVAA